VSVTSFIGPDCVFSPAAASARWIVSLIPLESNRRVAAAVSCNGGFWNNGRGQAF
jgi:hypothetical protein